MTDFIRDKRPVFLLVLCILSFVWIGFGILFGFGGLAVGPDSPEELGRALAELDKGIVQMEESGMNSFVPMYEKLKIMTIQANENFYAIQLVGLVVLATGLGGVLMMFKGQKMGFHLYIIYSILAICQVYFFHSPAIVPTFVIVFNLIFSVAFISMYAANLKWMR